MIAKAIITGALFSLLILSWAGAAGASFDILPGTAVQLEILGYNGLDETALFRGELAAGTRQNIATSYRGLALLRFARGQVYPVILDNQPFLIQISNPDTRPSFSGSDENEYFYGRLQGAETVDEAYEFANLMIKSRELLESTGSIRTVDELQAMKKTFHSFVRLHGQRLYQSDMLRRFIAQYFMMHEYIDYHVPGAPATDIRKQYQNGVMEGVRNWLEILRSNIPQHEILNYCVSLYYDRSMVTLASRIIENFREIASCPGDQGATAAFPTNLILADVEGNHQTFQELGGRKTVAFVSEDCPVSKVETVVKARDLAQQGNNTLIIVPLQPLSKTHLVMKRMVSGGRMLFVDDEKWRKENVSERMKLPRFIQMEN